MSDIIFEIENSFDLDKVKVDYHFIWEILRMPFFFRLLDSNQEGYKNKQSRLTKSLRYLFYGWRNWFKKYDIICFSNSGGGYRREIDGLYYNRFLDPIIEIIDSDRTLLIEKPDPDHYKLNSVKTKNIVSDRIVVLLKNILSKIMGFEIKNRYILDEIKERTMIDINYALNIKQFLTQIKIYEILFDVYKPKAIFLTCYYGKEGIILAAKNKKIPVIEIQHGIIGYKHPAYNHKIFARDYYPDYLLTFGEAEVNAPSENFIFEKNQVYAIGSHYINYIGNKKTSNPIEELINKFVFSVAVTMQSTIEEELLEFIIKAAILDESILYLLLPRKTSLTFLGLPENVKVITDMNFYEMMAYVDYHSTVYSTCAIEAPSLGVQNILINLQGLAKEYYIELLSDDRITLFVETPDELVAKIRNMDKLEKSLIKESNSDLFVQGYQDRLSTFLNQINLI